MEQAPQLSIAMSSGPDRTRLLLRGEIDLGTVGALRTRFNEIFAANGGGRAAVIVLDMTELTFCDSTGLRALLDVAHQCRRLGTTLRLVNVPSMVRHVMELTDTLDEFNIDVDLRSRNAIAHPRPQASEL